MIDFNKPYITDKEYYYMADALNRKSLSGDGYYTKLVSSFIENEFKTKRALLTTSCSSALDMSTLLLDLQPDDEVILPSYTFVSTGNSTLLGGGKIVFADISEDTLNMDPNSIIEKISNKTKAIIPVHYGGVSCDMDSIMDISRDYNVTVIEDAAQGVNGKYKDRYLGTIGHMGCYSFHETKNYSCGEGGALLINHSDELVKRAEIIREKGTNKKEFLNKEVDKYTWVDRGSSFLPSDILAALLHAQLEKLDEIHNKRKSIYETYYSKLKHLENRELLRLPIIPDYSTSNYHIFYILLNSEEERNYLMNKLKERGIQAYFHYVPLHLSPMGKRLGYKVGDLPKTEDLSARLLRLPIYCDLKEKEINYIIENIYEILI